MIHPPPEWPRSVGEHLLVVRPPGGGCITYHERLPVRSLVDIARELARDDPRFAEAVPGPPVRMATDEGELAGHTVLRAGSATRFIAAILTDEFVAALDGAAETTEEAVAVERAVRDLLREARLGLGVRSRRPCYAPPSGWSAVPNGLTTTWYPPRFPAERARIVVYPAHPSSDTATQALDGILADEAEAGFVVSGPVEVVSARGDGGLLGVRARCGGEWRHDCGRIVRELAVYTDGRYAYPSWFEAAAGTRGERLRAVYDRVAASVEPLPRPGGRMGSPEGEVSAPWEE